MKIRNGFVSNSSSSSFTISKKHLTEKQIEQIKNYHLGWRDFTEEEIENVEFQYYNYPEWDIYETDEDVFGHTIMDNFDIGSFLEKIGIDKKFIECEIN